MMDKPNELNCDGLRCFCETESHPNRDIDSSDCPIESQKRCVHYIEYSAYESLRQKLDAMTKGERVVEIPKEYCGDCYFYNDPGIEAECSCTCILYEKDTSNGRKPSFCTAKRVYIRLEE
jgi:hypothetical protein